MIVVDASAMAEALVGRDPNVELLDALAGDLHAPYLLDAETLSVFRGLVVDGKLYPGRAQEAISDYFAFEIARYRTEPLAARVWELRHNFTTYDAHYIALAEALDSPLLTCDQKLSSTDHRAAVTVFSRSQ